jgi:isopentenyl diphosphate isomerase/L-lactate dehydrogenase-like FMN-dependent dehydrogenase
MDMKEVRERARELMKGHCRVCPVCDGRVCAGEVPGMGGLGTGESFRANVKALADVRLAMRLIHDVAEPDLGVDFFGRRLTLPVLAAPIGGVSYNMGGAISESEYIGSKVGACVDKGLVCCTGDGVPDEILDSGLAAIAEHGGQGIPFIKPWADAELFAKMDKAAEAGITTMGMDIDAAGLVTLAKMGRPVLPKPAAKLKEIVSRWDGKFILKGVMTTEDAMAALDAGVDAIVVSNHGGRVLDFTPGTAEVLPDIARTVGDQTMLLVDGGVRTGADVLKMVALGADAVLIGRPFSIAVLGGGRQGAGLYIETLKTELTQAMVMTGTASIADADASLLQATRPGGSR